MADLRYHATESKTWRFSEPAVAFRGHIIGAVAGHGKARPSFAHRRARECAAVANSRLLAARDLAFRCYDLRSRARDSIRMGDRPQEDLLEQAQAGDPEAQNALGRSYARRGTDSESSDAAAAWFQRAAEQGFAAAKHNLGVLYLKAGRDEVARGWFGAGARDGRLPSMFALGMMCEEAGEVQKAVHLYDIAAARGHADAQDALGRLAFDRATPKDFETARYWSERAAEQGNARSQTRLGTTYHEGLGVERDPARAASYFLSAAKAGHAGAQLMIGVAYHLGIGVRADCLEAAYFLSLSSAQGSELARAYLPRVHADLGTAEKAAVESRLRQTGLA